MNAIMKWCLGGAVLIVVGACGADDNERVARDLAVAAATDAVTALGLGSDALAGDPMTHPCRDGLGNPTDARMAEYAFRLPTDVDEEALDRLVAVLSDDPLQDSPTDAGRLVVYAERRDNELVTVRVQVGDDGATLGVTVDCIG